jgi:hypothetical protein
MSLQKRHITLPKQVQQRGLILSVSPLLSGKKPNSDVSICGSGTSVSVYGTVRPLNGSEMVFTLDGAPPKAIDIQGDLSPGILYQEAFYHSGTLDDKQHSLVMTQTAVTNHGTIYLDFLTYTPSENSSRSGLQFLVDDQDDRIGFSGGWTQTSQQIGATMRTISSANTSGSWFQYEFEGDVVLLKT